MLQKASHAEPVQNKNGLTFIAYFRSRSRLVWIQKCNKLPIKSFYIQQNHARRNLSTLLFCTDILKNKWEHCLETCCTTGIPMWHVPNEPEYRLLISSYQFYPLKGHFLLYKAIVLTISKLNANGIPAFYCNSWSYFSVYIMCVLLALIWHITWRFDIQVIFASGESLTWCDSCW